MVIRTSDNTTSSSLPSLSDDRVAGRQHLLTVNVEDYFQVGVFQKFIQSDNWYRFESRLEQNVDYLLELLARHDTVATFFVLGWTAENNPSLVRKIAAAGHEIASRGFLHQPLLTLTRNEIRKDLIKSKELLEDVTGQPVRGFRLSDGWLSRHTLWLLDQVAEAGYTYDSSLMPRQRDFASEPEWRRIHTVPTNNGPLVEVPLSTVEVPGGWLPIAGGNYQRQIPDFLMRRLVDRAIRSDDAPFVMYFQVWELDDQQPRLSVADRLTKVRHYRKLGKYRRLLPQYLERYLFTSIRDHSADSDSPLHSLRDSEQSNTERKSLPLSTRSNSCTSVSEEHNDEQQESRQQAPPLPKNAEQSPAEEQQQGIGSRPPVTLVIPCFNEEKSVSYLANTLASVRQELSVRWCPSILFVDDCSTDNTIEALQQQFGDDPQVRIVSHETNRGVSAAILTGIRLANSDIVCSMDCDCSYDPHELNQMLPLLAEDASMVTASPYHPEGMVRNVPAWRLTLSRGLSWLYQRLLGESLSTWTSCFRVYRRNHILDLPLQEAGFLGTAELAAQLIRCGRLITEYPATLEVRLFGLSKMKTIRAILSHLKLLARVILNRDTASSAAESVLHTPVREITLSREHVSALSVH